jgi:hypothetical protein
MGRLLTPLEAELAQCGVSGIWGTFSPAQGHPDGVKTEEYGEVVGYVSQIPSVQSQRFRASQFNAVLLMAPNG